MSPKRSYNRRKRQSAVYPSYDTAQETAVLRNRPDPMKGSLLLQLPPEIRRMILKELLYNPEPLGLAGRQCYGRCAITNSGSQRPHATCGCPGVDFEKPRPLSLHTNILRTCRQFHHEGSYIFYSNTLACRVWYHGGLNSYFSMADMLGGLYDFRPPYFGLIPETICTKFARLHITVQVEETGWSVYDLERNSVRLITAALKRTPSWCHLTIRLDAIATDMTSRHGHIEDCDQVLRPFSYLRGLKHVEIRNTACKIYASKLATLMKSEEPVTDLDRLHEKLDIFVRKVVQPKQWRRDDAVYMALDFCNKARDLDDVEAYLARRTELLRLVDEHIEESRRQLQQCEPPLDWQLHGPFKSLEEISQVSKT